MSILIKGVKMPRGCIACPFMFSGLDDYLMWCNWIGGPLGEWSKYRDKWRHPACPLVEVPTPHGPLVDADALKATFCAECNHTITCEDCDIDYHIGRLAPTIIEAEEGAEE